MFQNFKQNQNKFSAKHDGFALHNRGVPRVVEFVACSVEFFPCYFSDQDA